MLAQQRRLSLHNEVASKWKCLVVFLKRISGLKKKGKEKITLKNTLNYFKHQDISCWILDLFIVLYLNACIQIPAYHYVWKFTLLFHYSNRAFIAPSEKMPKCPRKGWTGALIHNHLPKCKQGVVQEQIQIINPGWTCHSSMWRLRSNNYLLHCTIPSLLHPCCCLGARLKIPFAAFWQQVLPVIQENGSPTVTGWLKRCCLDCAKWL